MLLMHGTLDDDGVHDREDPGAPIILQLHVMIIGKEPLDLVILAEGVGGDGAEHCVDFARHEKVAERAA